MRLLEFIYFIGYSCKKYYDLKNREKLPHKVISVGNITAGGTGKTPAVIAIAEEAKRRGYQPCILTRGYRGKAAGPCFVSEGSGALIDVDEAGDEALLMAETLKGIAVIKSANRYKGGLFALERLNLQRPLFILDDGFQHWKLYRDTDIVLIDSTNPFGNMRLLPFGILREPLNGLKRADVVVLTRKELHQKTGQSPASEALMNDIRRYNSDAPVFLSEHRPAYALAVSGERLPVDVLSGKKAFLFCGIGNPAAFKDTIIRLNAEISGVMFFNDHHRYDEHDIAQIKDAAGNRNADWIVTTEKDIMKLKGFELPENLISLGIEFNIDRSFYEKIFREV